MDLKEQIKGELQKQKDIEFEKIKEANSKLKEFTFYTTDKSNPLIENTKKYLDSQGFKYIEKDVSKHKDEYNKIVSIVNMNVLPMILVNGVYLVYKRDFQNPQQLGNAIKFFASENYHPVTMEEGLIEFLKTTNYNLVNRLTQLEQRLTPVIRVMNELSQDLNTEKNAKKNK